MFVDENENENDKGDAVLMNNLPCFLDDNNKGKVVEG